MVAWKVELTAERTVARLVGPMVHSWAANLVGQTADLLAENWAGPKVENLAVCLVAQMAVQMAGM